MNDSTATTPAELSYTQLDPVYVALDKSYVRRTRNILAIPDESHRKGGKHAYAEWAHVIGIFQTLLYLQLGKKQDNIIVDVGCGTGLMAIASNPYLGAQGHYIGIDVQVDDVNFCRGHYDPACHSFLHLDARNPMYEPHKSAEKPRWAVDDASADMVTAVSVWTHLDEQDACFYFSEISRVLKPGGKAMITFFLLDELYTRSLPLRGEGAGRFHLTQQRTWIFDQQSYGSDAWRHPAWVNIPEIAIGLTRLGLQRLLDVSGLHEIAYYPGNWKEAPGVFFQDVLVFGKD